MKNVTNKAIIVANYVRNHHQLKACKAKFAENGATERPLVEQRG